MKNTRFLRYILVGAVMAFGMGAWGDDFTWNGGGGDGSWTNPANWTPALASADDGLNGYPDGLDTATIGGFTITFINLPATLATLTINDPAANITLGGNLTTNTLTVINGTLNLSGDAVTVAGTFTNNGTVQFSDTSTLAAGSVVNGGTSVVEYTTGTCTDIWGGTYQALTVGAPATLNLSGDAVTVVGAFTNNGTVQFSDTSTLAAGSVVNGGTSVVEYLGGGPVSPLWGINYQNITVSGLGTDLQTTGFTALGTLNISGGQISSGSNSTITAATVTLAAGAIRFSITGILTLTASTNHGRPQCRLRHR